MKLKIAILGTRGIPNHYGGFEQVSQFLSAGLTARGHEVTVYNSHNHPYKAKSYQGVRIIHCFDPEYILKTAGQFIYDFNCIMDARKRDYDVLLFMGYTSSSVWRRLFPSNTTIISNMDGFEWKRGKYSRPVRRFLKYAEKLAVRHSHFHIADSLVIQSYLKDAYKTESKYIPYGADPCCRIDDDILIRLGIKKQDYFLLMARMEPENNIDLILRGFIESKSTKKCIVIGNTRNRYGRYIMKKYAGNRIHFLGGIFDHEAINTLVAHSHLYFHGHSVGGTNPSLLEAMAGKALIAAHDNAFNRMILMEDALYFSDPGDVKEIVENVTVCEQTKQMIENNLAKIQLRFNWNQVVDEYEKYIYECHTQFNEERCVYDKRLSYK